MRVSRVLKVVLQLRKTSQQLEKSADKSTRKAMNRNWSNQKAYISKKMHGRFRIYVVTFYILVMQDDFLNFYT